MLDARALRACTLCAWPSDAPLDVLRRTTALHLAGLNSGPLGPHSLAGPQVGEVLHREAKSALLSLNADSRQLAKVLDDPRFQLAMHNKTLVVTLKAPELAHQHESLAKLCSEAIQAAEVVWQPAISPQGWAYAAICRIILENELNQDTGPADATCFSCLGSSLGSVLGDRWRKQNLHPVTDAGPPWGKLPALLQRDPCFSTALALEYDNKWVRLDVPQLLSRARNIAPQFAALAAAAAHSTGPTSSLQTVTSASDVQSLSLDQQLLMAIDCVWPPEQSVPTWLLNTAAKTLVARHMGGHSTVHGPRAPTPYTVFCPALGDMINRAWRTDHGGSKGSKPYASTLHEAVCTDPCFKSLPAPELNNFFIQLNIDQLISRAASAGMVVTRHSANDLTASPGTTAAAARCGLSLLRAPTAASEEGGVSSETRIALCAATCILWRSNKLVDHVKRTVALSLAVIPLAFVKRYGKCTALVKHALDCATLTYSDVPDDMLEGPRRIPQWKQLYPADPYFDVSVNANPPLISLRVALVLEAATSTVYNASVSGGDEPGQLLQAVLQLLYRDHPCVPVQAQDLVARTRQGVLELGLLQLLRQGQMEMEQTRTARSSDTGDRVEDDFAAFDDEAAPLGSSSAPAAVAQGVAGSSRATTPAAPGPLLPPGAAAATAFRPVVHLTVDDQLALCAAAHAVWFDGQGIVPLLSLAVALSAITAPRFISDTYGLLGLSNSFCGKLTGAVVKALQRMKHPVADAARHAPRWPMILPSEPLFTAHAFGSDTVVQLDAPALAAAALKLWEAAAKSPQGYVDGDDGVWPPSVVPELQQLVRRQTVPLLERYSEALAGADRGQALAAWAQRLRHLASLALPPLPSVTASGSAAAGADSASESAVDLVDPSLQQYSMSDLLQACKLAWNTDDMTGHVKSTIASSIVQLMPGDEAYVDAHTVTLRFVARMFGRAKATAPATFRDILNVPGKVVLRDVLRGDPCFAVRPPVTDAEKVAADKAGSVTRTTSTGAQVQDPPMIVVLNPKWLLIKAGLGARFGLTADTLAAPSATAGGPSGGEPAAAPAAPAAAAAPEPVRRVYVGREKVKQQTAEEAAEERKRLREAAAALKAEARAGGASSNRTTGSGTAAAAAARAALGPSSRVGGQRPLAASLPLRRPHATYSMTTPVLPLPPAFRPDEASTAVPVGMSSTGGTGGTAGAAQGPAQWVTDLSRYNELLATSANDGWDDEATHEDHGDGTVTFTDETGVTWVAYPDGRLEILEPGSEAGANQDTDSVVPASASVESPKQAETAAAAAAAGQAPDAGVGGAGSVEAGLHQPPQQQQQQPQQHAQLLLQQLQLQRSHGAATAADAPATATTTAAAGAVALAAQAPAEASPAPPPPPPTPPPSQHQQQDQAAPPPPPPPRQPQQAQQLQQPQAGYYATYATPGMPGMGMPPQYAYATPVGMQQMPSGMGVVMMPTAMGFGGAYPAYGNYGSAVTAVPGMMYAMPAAGYANMYTSHQGAAPAAAMYATPAGGAVQMGAAQQAMQAGAYGMMGVQGAQPGGVGATPMPMPVPVPVPIPLPDQQQGQQQVGDSPGAAQAAATADPQPQQQPEPAAGDDDDLDDLLALCTGN